MESTTDSRTNTTADPLLLEQLPEDLQAYCSAGQSVAELAHLAKNIIQMVSGSVEIMELGLERKQYDRVLRSWGIFEPNFVRLKKFVLDLIKYTKHYPLQKEPCDFNQVIQGGIRSCELLVKNKHVKIKLHQDKAIPPVLLDAERIEELVKNLVLHAFDNLADQVGTITLQTRYLPDSQQAQLRVSDDGPRLTQAMKQQLLRPFERTRNMVGTGFEIPLVLRDVQQHDGCLELDDGEQAGNCVHIYLPVNEELEP